MISDNELKRISRKWYDKSWKYEYSYHFTWLGHAQMDF